MERALTEEACLAAEEQSILGKPPFQFYLPGTSVGHNTDIPSSRCAQYQQVHSSNESTSNGILPNRDHHMASQMTTI